MSHARSIGSRGPRRDSVGTAILGAGPAGLAAAYTLALRNKRGVVYEASESVGGLARAVQRGRYRFHIGSQAFSSRMRGIDRLWEVLLGGEGLPRQRIGRCFAHEGAITAWLRYPRRGPGEMWDALGRAAAERGVGVRLGHSCIALVHDQGRVTHAVVSSDGNRLESRVDGVLSSVPLAELIGLLAPSAPPEVLDAATRLRHNSFCQVAIMTTERDPFPESWICLRETAARAERVQNLRAWSRDMVAPDTTCLCVEYSGSEDHEPWTLDEADAVEFAVEELARIGLADQGQVFDGAKIVVPEAYPVSDPDTADALAVLREYLQRFENLKTFGRNGLHRDSAQDHAMWTGMLAAVELLDGTWHDVWGLGPEANGSDPLAEPQSTFEKWRSPVAAASPHSQR